MAIVFWKRMYVRSGDVVMQWMKYLLIGACCVVTMPSIVQCASGESLAERSADDGHRAYAVQRGKGPISLTEIWVISRDDDKSRKLRAFPGEPGTLILAPNGEDLIYLERSLRHQAWASYYYGRLSLPITRNRVWKLSLHGGEEDLWPLPKDFQPKEIAPSPNGRTLAMIGYRGNPFERTNSGLWVADKTGYIRASVFRQSHEAGTMVIG